MERPFLIPRDKLLHVALGVLWLVLIAPAFWLSLGPALAYTSTVYAVLYEVNQHIRKDGQPEVWDAVATALPGWMAWLALEVAQSVSR